ncbi:DUF7302 family protein [Corynebacterium amycolatum]|nr:hypothetical protein [Corynebacterium amycolatum]STC40440.1 Uncharacterised protein [Corynebacterium amycolatum]
MKLVNKANGVEVSVCDERGQELLSEGAWERIDAPKKTTRRNSRSKTATE